MSQITPYPAAFLEWQIKLRAFTMQEQNGAPHVGVAPLVTVRNPSSVTGVTSHSLICGLLPHPLQLETKTADFERLYEEHQSEGSRATYDAGIDYLEGYYKDPSDFDAESVTTLLRNRSPLLDFLRADPHCGLLFYVFDLQNRSEVGRLRCWQFDCYAEVHEKGPIFDNVWWHNALFHGKEDEHVVVRFGHIKGWDTGFGGFRAL